MNNVLEKDVTSNVEEASVKMSVSEYYEFRKTALNKNINFRVSWETGECIVTADVFFLTKQGFFIE